jgi:MtN3 and saliva related transmembrane protein
MPTSEIIGFIATFLSVICFIPQAIKTIKTKDTEAISFWMYLLFLLSVIFWLIYGFMVSSLSIIVKNILVIILSSIILYLKIRNLLKKSAPDLD